MLVAVVMTTAVFSSAASSASPLHTLDRTPGPTQVCGNVVVHANAAIAATLHDDDAIAHSLVALRTADFDVPGAPRKQALSDLDTFAADVRQNVERGKSETLRLRDFAEHPAGEDRKADLEALSIGLDAALDSQRDVARTLDTFVHRISYRTLASTPDAEPPSNRVAPAFQSIPNPTTDGSDTYLARDAANRLAPKITEIDADEARAATHSESAIGGC